jgi:DNA invertase Pin-like site-specific DNA recombinase
MTTSTTSVVCYSYVRFSSKRQEQGDSLRRQTELAESYCRRRGWTLDTSLTLHDLGVSAFHGDNALIGNLRTFLDAVKRGTVPAGSVLLVESVDRISRQGIDEGYDIIKGILKKGVRLVTLSPEREFGPEAVKSLTKGALEIQLILERAAEESERKSERVRAAWHGKRQKARDGQSQPPRKKDGRVTRGITDMLPAWVEEHTGGLRLIPERAAVVQHIYQLAAAGYGISRIVKKLAADGVPAFGQSGRWTTSYVGAILRDRKALGEHQPRDRHHKPDGPPIPGYYPAAVTEEEWNAARAGAAERSRRRGRIAAGVNLFSGLLTDARTGESYMVQTRNDEGGRRQVLVNFAATQGRGKCHAFPLPVFEQAVLSLLKEIDPHEVLNGDAGPDETVVLAGQLAAVETELAGVAAFMDREGFSPTLGQRVKVLEAKKAVLGEELGAARHRARHKLSESWGEMRTLLDVLEGAADPEGARLRLRSALRRVVEKIVLLVVPRGRDRLAAVQIWFAGGKRHRAYLIFHRAARANKSARVEGIWWVKSFAATGLPPLDLRKPELVRRLEKLLLAVDLDVGQG